MNSKSFSRREFIKLSGLSLSALALSPTMELNESITNPKYAMVGNPKGVSIRKEPTDNSVILYQRYLDDIINVYFEVIGPDGPAYNPLWYRVWGGYVHSANLIEVKYLYNSLESQVKEGGQLTEVTVPFTRTMFFSGYNGWEPKYRFYYGSVHWITDIITGPDDKPWYKVKDELLKVELAVPAEHLRYIPDNELEPISQDIAPENKRIEISINQQTLKAFENNVLVLDTKISSGVASITDRATPIGRFNIMTKMPSKHMGDGKFTSDIYAYELMGVPWNCFFEMKTGVATHGTYWHTNFGSQMSHGCINMLTSDAKWLYRWTTPVASPDDWSKHGLGTRVDVI